MTDLLTIVPTRTRPHNLAAVVQAWHDTHAFDDGARLLFAVDADDPAADDYHAAFQTATGYFPGPGLMDERPPVEMIVLDRWMPLVPKLNGVTAGVLAYRPDLFAVGFAGDDHLPRTPHWAARYVAALRGRGTGIVHGRDGYQDGNIPTEWAMTTDICRALERMVPAPVDHLYCDNSIQDLGARASCLVSLDDVLIEHMNPYADGKAPMDAQYERVNSADQYTRDGLAYKVWKRTQLKEDAQLVQALMNGQTVPGV